MHFRNLLVVGLVSAMALVGCGGGGGGKDGGTGGGTGGGAMGGGTGGGATGGGTGGGATGGGTGGGSGTCGTISQVGPANSVGNYNMYFDDGGVRRYQYWEGGVFIPHTDGGFDLMIVERWWDSQSGPVPMFPRTVPIPANNTINDCFDCVYYLEDCMPGILGGCAKMYFATRGTLNYLAGDRNPDAGVFIGNGTGLHLVEWDYDCPDPAAPSCVDRAVPNGTCKDVARFEWDAGWP
jgi:hypothetical protein